MKIAYISHARYPTEKAYGVQMTRVCEALTTLGHEVTMVAPAVHSEITQSYTEYYDVKNEFGAEYLPVHDALHSQLIPGRFAMLFTMHSYKQALRKHLVGNAYDLLYVRSPYVLAPLLRFGVPVALELHTVPKRFQSRFIQQCKQCKLVVCLTEAMRQELVSLGVPENKVVVEADAVGLGRFEWAKPATLEMNVSGPVVGYVGSLTTMDHLEKGANMLISNAAAWHEEHQAFTLIVGGPQAKAEQYREQAKHLGIAPEALHIMGPVPSGVVPSILKACSVCVYPAPKSDHPFFMRDTSPLKLFEYMAAGIPVVCADIPPVRDIVDESAVWLFPAGDEAALQKAVSDALTSTKEAAAKVKKAKDIVAHHTWEKRMQRVLSVLEL